MNSYVKLGIAVLIPVVVSVLFYLAESRTRFSRLPYKVRQIIIGIVFGCLAIIGTEWGIPVKGAQVNCRDAAPLCAGLFFGAPAGIIAGVIGAVERWFAVYWGVGQFTRVACSVATLIAGIYAALLRKFLFDDKRPSWMLALTSGVVIEVFHLSLVFVTNVSEQERAASVIEACSLPLIIATSLSVLLSAIAVAAAAHDNIALGKNRTSITITIQRGMLICVTVAFLVTTVFINTVQTGIAENHTEKLLVQSISDEMAGKSIRNVGNSGYITDQKKIDSPVDLSGMKEGEMSEVTAYGVKAFAMYKYVDDRYVIAVLPLDEAYQTRNASLFANSFMEVLVFASMFLLLYLLVKNVVVNKMREVNRGLEKITSGELDKSIDVRRYSEFNELSDGINSTVDTLKNYIEDAKSRIDKELKLAKDIQAASLPDSSGALASDNDKFDIYACMFTAKEVGGDFYDFFMSDSKTLNFLIADVSGKGIPAAMFMMRAKAQIRSLSEGGTSLGHVFTASNNALCDGNETNMFVTSWMGAVNLEDGTASFVNAGHNPPLVRRKNGQFEFLRVRSGFVLGGMESVNYKTTDFKFERGDVIFLYTDGVTEAANMDNELFGEKRLIDALNSQKTDNPKEICSNIKKKVDEFVGDAPQFDDITMLAFRFDASDSRAVLSFNEAAVDDIEVITDKVSELLEKAGASLKIRNAVSIAVDEIYSNIVNYAYGIEKGPASVKIELLNQPEGVRLSFMDSGIKYDPLTREDPDITLGSEERQIGGLGIFMVKKLMDDISYEYRDGKNVLSVFKKF